MTGERDSQWWGGHIFLCDGPLQSCLKSWVFSLIVIPVNNICWFHQILWQLGCIAPHHIDILGYNPQWNVFPPNIPHIVLRHHWEHRSGSFLIPCWSFDTWSLLWLNDELCIEALHSHNMVMLCEEGFKGGSWLLKDRLWGLLSMSERREEGVWLVDKVDMASGHHCVVCCWKFVMWSSIRCRSTQCCSIWCSRLFKDCNRKR